MYSCIIFDVDGTLIDTEGAVFSSYRKVIFEEFGRTFGTEDMAAAYGVPTAEALSRLGFINIEEAYKRYHKHLMDSFCDVKAFSGVFEVLDCLKKNNIVTGIVTSRTRSEVMDDPCLQGLMDYLGHIICADDTKRHKPDPEPILKFLEKADVDISKALYIGDTHYDYKCARGAGVHFGLALWGARNIDNIAADYDFREPMDVLATLGMQR